MTHRLSFAFVAVGLALAGCRSQLAADPPQAAANAVKPLVEPPSALAIAAPDGFSDQPATTTPVAAIPVNCVNPYEHGVSWVERPSTHYPTDVIVADMNADGWPDVVLSSGADKQAEPLTVMYNSKAGFSRQPWTSSPANYVRIAVGDLDHDGFFDLVASIYSSHKAPTREAVHVYMNRGGILPSEPTYRIKGFGGIALGLGDFNGDGWLDLSVGQYDTPAAQRGKSWQYIYFNEFGTFDFATPTLTRAIASDASTHVIADLDQNGTLDLLVATAAAAWGWNFLGERQDDRVTLAANAKQLPRYDAFGWGLPSFVAIGRRATNSTALDMVLSFNTDPFSAKPTSFVGYDGRDNAYNWTSTQQGLGGGVALVDVNSDDHLDLVGAQFSTNRPGGPYQPLPLLIFCGEKDRLLSQGAAIGGENFEGQGVAVGDLDRSGLRQETFTQVVTSTPLVVTLPHAHIHAIDQIRYGNRDLTQEVGYVATGNWLTIPRQSTGNQTLTVRYWISDSLDLVVADRHQGREGTLPILVHANAKIASEPIDRSRAWPFLSPSSQALDPAE